MKFFVFFDVIIFKIRYITNLAVNNFKKFVLKMKSNDLSTPDIIEYDEEG